MKSVVISQSNYIPWIGFFRLLNSCNEYIILDDVQFTRRDWRNRNIIRVSNEKKWLTIPLENKGQYKKARILEMKISDPDWSTKHYKLISSAYKAADFWPETAQVLVTLYKKTSCFIKLTDINRLFLEEMCRLLKINCKISISTDYYSLQELDRFNPSERLSSLARASGSSIYLSGPAAKSYLDLQIFKQVNIKVKYANYERISGQAAKTNDYFNTHSIVDTLANFGLQQTNEILRKHKLCLDTAK